MASVTSEKGRKYPARAEQVLGWSERLPGIGPGESTSLSIKINESF